MNSYEKIDQLLNEIRDRNNDLLDQLRKMKGEDQKYYSEKVYQSIEKSQELIKKTYSHE
jgi:hypothetical protein